MVFMQRFYFKDSKKKVTKTEEKDSEIAAIFNLHQVNAN